MLPRSSDVEACWRTSRRQTTLAAVRRHARCCQALHALPCPVTSPASWLCDGPWLRVMVSSLNGIRQCAILCSLQQRCSGRPHSRREGVGETRVRLWWHQECAFTRTHTHTRCRICEDGTSHTVHHVPCVAARPLLCCFADQSAVRLRACTPP